MLKSPILVSLSLSLLLLVNYANAGDPTGSSVFCYYNNPNVSNYVEPTALNAEIVALRKIYSYVTVSAPSVGMSAIGYSAFQFSNGNWNNSEQAAFTELCATITYGNVAPGASHPVSADAADYVARDESFNQDQAPSISAHPVARNANAPRK